MATGDIVYKETSEIYMHKGSRTLIQYLRSQTNKTNKLTKTLSALGKSTECYKTKHNVYITILLLLNLPTNFHYLNIIKKLVIIIILIHQPYSQVFGRLTKG